MLEVFAAAPVFVFSLDWGIVVQLLLTVFMPIAVGYVTTRETSGGKKAVLLATFTLISALLTQLGAAIASSTPFDVGLALLSVIPAFAISVATYYGLWKPTGVTEKAQESDVPKLIK